MTPEEIQLCDKYAGIYIDAMASKPSRFNDRDPVKLGTKAYQAAHAMILARRVLLGTVEPLPPTPGAQHVLMTEAPAVDDEGWIPHKSGDPMPCYLSDLVFIKLESGNVNKTPIFAGYCKWSKAGKNSITHWKRA